MAQRFLIQPQLRAFKIYTASAAHCAFVQVCQQKKDPCSRGWWENIDTVNIKQSRGSGVNGMEALGARRGSSWHTLVTCLRPKFKGDRENSHQFDFCGGVHKNSLSTKIRNFSFISLEIYFSVLVWFGIQENTVLSEELGYKTTEVVNKKNSFAAAVMMFSRTNLCGFQMLTLFHHYFMCFFDPLPFFPCLSHLFTCSLPLHASILLCELVSLVAAASSVRLCWQHPLMFGSSASRRHLTLVAKHFPFDELHISQPMTSGSPHRQGWPALRPVFW